MGETRREKCLRLANELGSLAHRLSDAVRVEDTKLTLGAAALLREIANEVCENCEHSEAFNASGCGQCDYRADLVLRSGHCDEWTEKQCDELPPCQRCGKDGATHAMAGRPICEDCMGAFERFCAS